MDSEASQQNRKLLTELAFIDLQLWQLAGRLAHSAQMNLVTAHNPSAAAIKRHVASLAEIQHRVRSVAARFDR